MLSLIETILCKSREPPTHFRRLNGLRIEVTGGDVLKRLVESNDGWPLLNQLVDVANRVLLAIRNLGTPSTGVMFARYVVLFPPSGDTTFYERLERQILANPGKPAPSVTAQSFVLDGHEPRFGYDI